MFRLNNLCHLYLVNLLRFGKGGRATGTKGQLSPISVMVCEGETIRLTPGKIIIQCAENAFQDWGRL